MYTYGLAIFCMSPVVLIHYETMLHSLVNELYRKIDDWT